MDEKDLEQYYLNEHGKIVFRHKTNQELFIERAYHWKDSCVLIHEHEKPGDNYTSRQIIDSYRFSTYDFGAWTPMTKEQYDSVKSCYKEIYQS